MTGLDRTGVRVAPPSPDDPEIDAGQWFEEHYHNAADQVVAFLEGDDIALAGKTIADIGCGDGLIDLGVYHRGDPRLLVGYDIRRVDVDALDAAARNGGVQALPAPDRLTFVTSEPDAIPAPNDTFDVVFSWSTFEHVSKPVAMLREIKRILKPSGVFFLQIWPLYYSEHGGHLWQLIPEPFPQLQMPPYAIERRIQGRLGTDRSRDALDEFRSLNRMTLDDLQRALLAAGLRPAKVELMSQVFHVPQPLAHFSLSALAVAGVKMLVVAG